MLDSRRLFALDARALSAIALCALGILHLLYHAQYTLDDAYISFRYSRNLVRGLGLVYNPGEYVKGYSNTLYTFAMALPELLGRDPIWLAKLIGLAAFGIVCTLGYRLYASDPSPEVRDRGTWFVALCAVSTPLAVHFMNGLETASYTALVMAAVLARLREQRSGGAPWSALLFCAVIWSRPEGIALFGAMALHDAALRVRTRTLSARDLLFYAAPAVAYASELGLSQLYYGDPLPQTFRAKVAPAGGVLGAVRALWHGVAQQAHAQSYLARGLDFVGPGLAVLLLLPLSLLSEARRRINAALLLVVLALLAFIARAGNDWAPAFRFGVPMLPLVFVLLIEAIAAVAELYPARPRLGSSLLIALVLASVLPLNLSQTRKIQAARYVDAAHKLVEGKHLAELADSGITLASADIGGHGYGAGGFDILDTAGLTSRELVHCYGGNQRCRRYVTLVRAELIRRHPSGHDDGVATDRARRSGQYLSVDEGRYFLLRTLALLPSLPEHAEPSAGSAAGDLRLAGTDLPPAVLADSESVLTLFWTHASASIPPARQLEWRHGTTTIPATASAAVWTRMKPRELWTTDLLFADRVVIRTPQQPGAYVLWATVQGASVPVGSIEIVAKSAAPVRALAIAKQAAQLAQAGRPSAAIVRYERALQLDGAAAVRASYQSLVISRAQRLTGEADRVAARDPAAALALLREAKTWLHRAFWQSGRADPKLRRAIDANAERFTALIEPQIAHLASPIAARH
jgi:hypothetical protein